MGTFSVMWHDKAPSVSIVRADDRMLVTFYLPGYEGEDDLTFEIVRKQGGLFAKYERHFKLALGHASSADEYLS